MFRIGILLLFPLLLLAKSFSYAQVHSMPRSIEKDYYIWRLLQQPDTTKAEAEKIIQEAKRISPKLKKAYRKKTGKRAPVRQTRRSKPLTPKEKAALKKRQQHARMVLKQPDPLAAWQKEPDREKLFIFNNAGTAGRKKLDHTPDKALWKRLCSYGAANGMISRLRKEALPQFKKALLYPLPSKHALNYTSLNYMAFHALYAGQEKRAADFFARSARKASDRERADRALFWAYMTSRDKGYLRKLVKSYDINLYTLLARDFLKLKYPKAITPDLPRARLLSHEEITSPIYWAKLKKKIFTKGTDLNSLAEHYRSEESVGYYTYIKSKASRETEHYFPMPYRKLLGKLPKTRQAIMYAIARQESRFIPGSVSSSYALGLMQIMPFLVDHLAKERKEQIDYDDMFDPRTSLIYANEHMNYLTKWLQHPLYIAYAYNAGIGFTRRMLKAKKLFVHNRGYEPYLSIEKLPNAQANRYGKHVLVNYVIYMNKLGVPLRMRDLLATLHQPEKTDKFRK